MSHSSTNNWFSINLNEPHIVIPEVSISDPQHHSLEGTIFLRLTKPTKVKSLSIVFVGYARTSFYLETSNIPGAQPCFALDKHNFGSTLVEQKQTLLLSESKAPLILPVGTHQFPFSLPISSHLPAVITSKDINIDYQLTASLHTTSILPFSSPFHITKPVILLQRDELPSDNFFNTAVMRISSEEAARLSGQISIPCSVLPQAATIPLMLNLNLKGNATTVTKITIELLESIYYIRPSADQVLVDERLVTRQNCPIQDWPSSTPEEPAPIIKRLIFRVPQLPLTHWCKSDTALSLSSPRSKLEKGFCLASGTYTNASVKVTHSIRFVIHFTSLSKDAESVVEYGIAENETAIRIVSNQEYKEDGVNPPSYYRSFSTTLVEGDKIHEIDQQAIEALQDDWPLEILPPCYEDYTGSFAESVDLDTYAADLAAYTQRYAHARPVFAI